MERMVNLNMHGEKKSKGSQKKKRKPDKINELILKTKADLKEGPDNI